jgi:hypothetical protein
VTLQSRRLALAYKEERSEKQIDKLPGRRNLGPAGLLHPSFR